MSGSWAGMWVVSEGVDSVAVLAFTDLASFLSAVFFFCLSFHFVLFGQLFSRGDAVFFFGLVLIFRYFVAVG